MDEPDQKTSHPAAAEACAVGSATDEHVMELLEQYLAAAHTGRAPDRESFVAGHPEVADKLRVALVGCDFVRRAGQELAEAVGDGPAAPRETLGDFRIVREIGRGGMAVVYEAEQISLGRRVALKVLPFAAVLDDRQLQRFKHEAQAAALLHHTNIVPVYSVGTERGVHYYAMEFVEGRTLGAVVQELREARRHKDSAAHARARRPSPRKPVQHDPPSSAEARALTTSGDTETPDYCRAVAKLGVQAAEALDHAHQQGVVHRDVKPGNLMVDAAGRLWITDFGLALSRANSPLTLTGAIVGTIGYMSPEQALGKRVPVDHRTDVYSLGVTLLEMLTLEPAFAGDDPRHVIHDVAFKEPPSPRRRNAAVPPALETILLKAVAKDPEARFATAQEMADDLRRFLAHEPIRARRAPLLDRVSLWVRRHRVGVAAAACVLLVSLVALAVDSVRGAAARQQILDALEREERSAADARAQAARAEASLAKAREAIDRMLTRVASRGLTGVPGFESVRRALLKDAADLYEDLLASSGDDPKVLLEAARAFRLLAERHGSLGDFPTAEGLIDRSRAMLVRLAPEDGPSHPALHEMAQVERYRGYLMYSRGRPADALPVLAHAVALAERNAKERPDLAPVSLSLVRALQTHGDRLRWMTRFAEAESTLRRAVAVGEAARERWPADADLRASLTSADATLAGLLQDVGKRDEGERCWRRAVEVSAEDLQAAADSDGFNGAVGARAALAGLLLDENRVPDALPLLRSVAEARVRQTTEYPRYPAFARNAMSATGALAVGLFRVGDEARGKEAMGEALVRFDRIRSEFAEARNDQAFASGALAGIAEALVFADRPVEADVAYRRAADSLRALAAAAPTQAAPQHRLAQVLSNWAQHVGQDEALGLAREAVAAARAATDLPDAVPEYGRELANAWWQLGQRLEGSGDGTEAETALRRAVEAWRQYADAAGGAASVREALASCLADWGEQLIAVGRSDEGERAVRESIEILRAATAGPDHDETLGRTLVVLSQIEDARGGPIAAEGSAREAAELLRRSVAQNPNFARPRALLVTAYGHLGGLLMRAGRAEDALASYQEAARLLSASSGRFIAMRHNCGLALLAAGRSEEAEREFRSLIEMAAESADEELARFAACTGWSGLGSLYRDTGRTWESVQAFEQALQILPSHREALPLVVLELADGREPSLRDSRRAVEIARDAVAHAGAEHPADGKSDRWMPQFEIQPEVAWTLLGAALVCDGAWEEALAAFAKSRELGCEHDGTDWVYEALAHARLGQADAARRYHEMAEEWFAEHEDVATAEERFGRRRAEVADLLDSVK